MITAADGHVILDRDEAYAAIKAGDIQCEGCRRAATDLHNHREEAGAWLALCGICHAELEARECAWTPIGRLAARYADVVRSLNQLRNRRQAHRRMDWDAIDTDLNYPIAHLEDRREWLGRLLDEEAKAHPMYGWLGSVYGVGPRSAALLIAVEERAFAQGITSVRNQRKYFGFIPGQKKQRAEIPWHGTCKWMISQALGQTIQTKKGLFGELYDYYRQGVADRYDKKAHQHNYTMARVMREFMKALCLAWREYEGLGNGNRHPDDDGPRPEHWVA